MKTINISLLEGDATVRIPYPMTAESFEMLLDMIKIQGRAWIRDLIQEDYQI
mgnify:CR=1 FL=1